MSNTENSGAQEIDVPLTEFDMDHLSEGQPVFKQGEGENRLVLRFDGFNEWGRIPIEELEALADEWEMNGNLNIIADSEGIEDASGVAGDVFHDCAQELRSLIQEYRGVSDE